MATKSYRQTGVADILEFSKGGAQIKNNAGVLEARNNADSAFTNMSGLAPTAPEHFTTKQYVDNLSSGITWKEPVRVATVAPGTLTSSFAAGQIIDGVTLVLGDRILIKNQASASENGIYEVTAGTPTRASDMAAGSDAASNAMFVQEGTANADIAFVCTDDTGSAVVGTDPLTFVAFASITGAVTSIVSVGAGTSLVESGAASTPQIRSLDPDASNTITFAVGTDVVEAGVTPGSIGTTELEDGGVTVAKQAPLATQASFRASGTFASGSPIAIGTLPANAEVTETRVNVDTAFVGAVGSPTLTLGTSGNPTALQTASDNDLASIGTYLVEEPNSSLSGQALIATLDPAGSGVGSFTVDVFYRVIS